MADAEPISTNRTLPTEITVLQVDDDGAFLDASKVALERERNIGSVVTTTSVPGALDAIHEHDVDCIVSDYEVGDRDGLDLLSEIRQWRPNLPFIMLTGTGNEEVAIDAISEGVTDYLRKRGGEKQLRILADRIRTTVEQRRIEKEVHRGFKAIETAREGIGLIDDGDFIYANEAYADIYGYDQESLVGTSWAELNVEDLAGRFEDEITSKIEEEGEWSGEAVGERKNGSTFPVHLTLSKTNDGAHVCVVQDVTVRSRRERRLREQNERLEDFASVVSHDLRNPLSVANVHLQMARETGDREHLDELEDSLDRMDDIITDLLELAHEGGDATASSDRVSLPDVFQQAWESADTAEATLRLDLPSETVVLGEESRLVEFASNLVRNAVEHAGEDVTVRVGRTDDGFYVADDGPGIPPDEREAVFASGYSTAASTGLGLGIVSRIVDQHGWDVSVTESEDGGARFEVTDVTFA